MSGTSALDYERFDQEARRVLLEHHTSKNVYHGAGLLSVAVAFFTSLQVYNVKPIGQNVPFVLFALFLSSLVVMASVLMCCMLYTGGLCAGVFRAYPSPPYGSKSEKDHFQSYVLLLETWIVDEMRSGFLGALFYVLRRHPIRFFLFFSEFPFVYFLFVSPYWRTLISSASQLCLQPLESTAFFTFLAFVIMIVVILVLALIVRSEYRKQKKEHRFFLKGWNEAVCRHRMYMWAEQIHALTGVNTDTLYYEGANRFCQNKGAKKDPF